MALAAGAAGAEYRIEPLGTLGGPFSRAQAVSASGLIAGYAYTADNVEHAFLYGGAMADLGTLGGDASRAYDLNAAGQVVGWAQDASGAARPVYWDSSGIHPLPTLGGDWGAAYGASASGRIVGYAYLDATVYHAALWQGGAVTDLGTLGGTYSIAYDVNAAGHIAGAAKDPNGAQWACLWTDPAAAPQNLGALPGASGSAARGINDLGQTILWNYGLSRAALRDGASLVDLGTLGGEESWAYGLNNMGQVVGWAELPSGFYHAFVWADADGDGLSDPGEMHDLGTLGGLFSSAYGVNDDGVVVGYAQDAAYQWQAVRWTPIPEPATATVLAAGLAAALYRRRRRRHPES